MKQCRRRFWFSPDTFGIQGHVCLTMKDQHIRLLVDSSLWWNHYVFFFHIAYYTLYTYIPKGQGYGFAFIHKQEKLLGNPWAINHSWQPSDTFPPFILHLLPLIIYNLIVVYFFMHQFQDVWLTAVGIYLMDSQSVLLLPDAIPASYCHLNNSLFVDDNKQSLTTVT